jgi:alpha-tubulin suppressor-like RCC1 family protein
MLPVVRYLGNGAVSRSFALLLCSIIVSGCSLKSANDSAHLSLVLPNPHRAALAQSNLSGSQYQGLAPSAWNDPGFACYGVNVTGVGIADSSANPNPNPDFAALLAGTTSCAYRGIVSNGFTFTAGQAEVAIDLQVPPGANRVIQLIGITNAAYCASNFLETGGATNPGAYEIGHVHADLFGDSSVSIPITYTASESKRVDCGNGNPATVLTAPNLAYSPVSLIFTRTASVGLVKPTNTGGAVTSCTISPTLPAGLALDPTNCNISGVPTALSSPTTYTAVGTNAVGPSSATFTITVNDTVPVISFSSSTLVFTKNGVISPQTPTNTGGAITGCAGALPPGLVLNTSTCAITGTPTAISAAANYTITASNSGGNAAAVVLSITINDAPPSGLAYVSNPAIYTQGVAIATNTMSSSGGAVLAYTVAPALPAGLALNAATGDITGTPTGTSAASNYTVTGTNSGGSSPVVLSITVNAPSALAWTPATFAFAGTAVGSNSATQGFTLTNTGGTNATSCTATTNTNSTDFTITADTCTSTISPAGTCTVTLKANPTSAGAKSTTLGFTCGSASASTSSITVTGLAPALAWSPLSQDFGPINVGFNSSTQTFTLTNSGGAAATGCSPPSITDTTNFTILTDTCGTANLTASGGTCTVSIRGNPLSSGAHPTTLSRTCTVGSTASTNSNMIIVTGIQPTLTWSPLTKNFGSVSTGGGSSTVQVFTLTNSGTATATGCSAPTLSGTNPGDFTMTSDTCGTSNVGPSGGNCTISVKAVPTAVGSRTATLSRNCTFGGIPSTTANGLSVTGLAQPTVAITSPASGSFVNAANKSAVAISGTCSETGQNVVLSGDGSASVACTAGTWTVNVDFSAASEGVITLNANHSSATGGVAVQGSRSFTKDTVAPAVAISSPAANAFINLANQGSFTVAGTCSENSRNVVISGAASATVVCTAGSWTANLDFTAASQNSVTVYVDHADAAGNNATQSPRTFIKDTVIPTLAITGPAANSIYNKYGDGNVFHIIGNCSENGQPVTITSGAASGTANCAALHFDVPVNVTALTTDAAYTFTANMMDAAGNPATPGSLAYNIENSPVFTLVSGQQSTMKPVFTFRGGAVGDRVRLLVNSTASCAGGTERYSGATAVTVPGQINLNAAETFSPTGVESFRAQIVRNSNPIYCTATAINYTYKKMPSVTQAASGVDHTCVLTAAGGVKCAGNNAFGQLGDGTNNPSSKLVDVVSFSSGVQSISSSYGYSCAVLTSGAIKCWGNNAYGQLGNNSTTSSNTPVSVSGIASGATAVSVGATHACALVGTSVKCWGRNVYGELGNNTVANSSVPVAVTGTLTGATAVSVGDNHSCAISTSGGIFCWGKNNFNQLDDTTTTTRMVSVATSTSTGATALSVGATNSCALISGNTKCWGSNVHGESGNGTLGITVTAATIVSGASGAISISLSGSTACVVLSNNTARCWGQNDFGQLGNSATGDSLTLQSVSGPVLSSISVGNQFVCGVTTASEGTCWGNNFFGQFGNGSIGARVIPQRAQNGISIDVLPGALASTRFSTCGISSGAVKCWGGNAAGYLGNGTTLPTTTVSTPITSGATFLAAGAGHTCAIVAGGLNCWGENNAGQIGMSPSASISTPNQVFSSGVTAVAVGSDYTCAIQTGVLKCWGGNAYGQLGIGSTTNTYTPSNVTFGTPPVSVAAGTTHTCAVDASGLTKCWGSNSNGQLGDGSTTSQTAPTTTTFASGVTQLALGTDHSCAVHSGDLKCWGNGLQGQLGIGTMAAVNSAPVIAIPVTAAPANVTAGLGFTCATVGGEAKCWGMNTSGQLASGTTTGTSAPMAFVDGLSGTNSLSAGYDHACANDGSGKPWCWGNNSDRQVGVAWEFVPSMMLDPSAP